jgi:PAS domain S-box-containing protein
MPDRNEKLHKAPYFSTEAKLLLMLIALLAALSVFDLHIYNLIFATRELLGRQDALAAEADMLARLSRAAQWVFVTSLTSILILGFFFIFNIYSPMQSESAAQARKHLSAIEASGDGIGIIDPAGKLIYMNRALMRLHGLEDADMQKYLDKDWQDLYPEKGKKFLQDIVLPRLRAHGSWRGESPIQRGEKEIVYADMTLNLLEDGGIIGTARDITARKAAEAERADLHRQLVQAQKMEAIGRLTGGIAHDFNNMLTVISGNLQLIDEHKAEVPAIAPFIAAADRAARRCAGLTHRLLAFSRQQVLKPRRCDINDLIGESIKLIARALGDNIEIAFAPGSSGTSRIDPAQFENALLNLSINARDAMPAGGTIAISTSNAAVAEGGGHADLAPGNYIRVDVEDTGAGIPEAIIKQVFEPFFTTKETGKGSGLGLSMVYGFARQSGGGTCISSREGRGTKVSLWFPCDKGAPEAAARSDGAQGGGALPRGRENVLIVENEPDLLGLAAAALRPLGYNIFTASSGPEAVLALDDIPQLHLLLTDITMPGGIDGRELAAEARHVFPQAAVLFMTGNPAAFKSGEEALSSPSSGILMKPFSRELLARRVRSALDRAAPRKTADAPLDERQE